MLNAFQRFQLNLILYLIRGGEVGGVCMSLGYVDTVVTFITLRTSILRDFFYTGNLIN